MSGSPERWDYRVALLDHLDALQAENEALKARKDGPIIEAELARRDQQASALRSLLERLVEILAPDEELREWSPPLFEVTSQARAFLSTHPREEGEPKT